MIGVLGGMGPLATVDFFAKIIAATSATHDAAHIPLLIQSDPRIPPRPAAILAAGESPLPALLAGRDRLIAAGALALAMPCNTAHFWYPALRQNCAVPFLSILDACCDELPKEIPFGAKIGIIGTRATLSSGLFSDALMARHYSPVLPDEEALNQSILPAIALVKAGRLQDAGLQLEDSVEALLNQGAATVILACTEIPMALDAVQAKVQIRCIDSTAALARACVAWWHNHGNRLD